MNCYSFLIQKRQDFQLIPQPRSIAIFVDRAPMLFGPAFTESKVRFLSLPEAAPQSNIGDVLDSVEVFYGFALLLGSSAILLTILLMKFCLYIHSKYGNSVDRFSIAWLVLSAVCQQPSFNFTIRSLKYLSLFLLLFIFVVSQYYLGNFSTELTLTPERKTLNSFQDFLSSKRNLSILRGDTSKLFMKQSKDSAVQKSYLEYSKSMHEFSSFSASQLVGASSAVRVSNLVVFGVDQTRVMIRAVDCVQQSQKGMVDKTQLYDGSNSYNAEIRLLLMNRNITYKIRNRVEFRFQRLIEAAMIEKETMSAYEHMADSFGVAYDFNFTFCAFPFKIFERNHVLPLDVYHFTKLFKCYASCVAIASLLVVAEGLKTKFMWTHVRCFQKQDIRTFVIVQNTRRKNGPSVNNRIVVVRPRP